MVMSATGGRPRTVGKRFSAAGLTFVLAVLAEVLVFVGVAHLIGLGWAFLALIAVSFFGLWLMRHEGPRAWREFRTVAAAGGRPGAKLTRHAVGLLAGILVAVPGFLSALVGLSLFVPPVRSLAGKAATGFATRRMSSGVAGDLFGPRRVRVKTGPVQTFDSGRFDSGRVDSGPVDSDPQAPIEGEIV